MIISCVKVLREIFLIPVHVYRLLISPLKGGSVCNYTPSCSEYFLTSVRRFGIIRGTVMGCARILRCRPQYFGGSDPVPEAYSWKSVKDQYIVRRKPKGFDREVGKAAREKTEKES